MEGDNQRITMLIRLFMRGKLSEAESAELDEWLSASDENMLLFERITDSKNSGWARAWLQSAGIKPAGTPRPDRDKWYRRDRTVPRRLIVTLAILVGIVMLIELIGPGIMRRTLERERNTRAYDIPMRGLGSLRKRIWGDDIALEFKKAPLEEVAKSLSGVYQVKIEYVGKRKLFFTGRLSINNTLYQSLEVLEDSLALEAKREGQGIALMDKEIR